MDVESVQMMNGGKSKPRRNIQPLLLGLVSLSLVLSIIALGLAGWTARRSDKAQEHLDVVANKNVAVVAVASGSKVKGYTSQGSLFAGTGYWAREKDMLHQRSDHQVVASGSDIFLIGGFSNSTAPASIGKPIVLDSIVKYDTYSGDLTEMPNMPQPRYRFGAALLNNKIYVAGGFEAPDNGSAVSVGSTAVFDIAAGAWLPAGTAGDLNTPRSDHCCYAAAGKVYCAGGWSAGYTDTLASVEELDPNTGKWTLIANMTIKRGDLKCATVNDRFYAMGGVTVASPPGVDCSTNFLACNPFTAVVERYDPATKKWERRADMLNPRGDFAADPLPNGRIFVMGGETTNGVKNQFALHYTEVYVEADDVWVPKAPLPEARFRFDAGHVKDRVYIFGGHPTCNDDPKAPLAEQCFANGLQSIFGYFDIQYPNVYVLTKNGAQSAEKV